MTREETLRLVTRGRLIAILRGDFGNRIEEIGDILCEAGVVALEVTMNSPRPFDSVARLARRYGSGLAVGVGTVRTVDEVGVAADCGSSFVVSPECSEAVIAATRARGMVSLPGCFSPTEIARATSAGADGVKLFPAVSLGPDFVRAMREPSPELRMMPTGGVTVQNAAEWLQAGAWALGVGRSLVNPQCEAAEMRARADAFVTACRNAGR